MLFGWAVVFAILLGEGTAPTAKRAAAHVWMEYEARPTPLNLDLKAPPIEFKSIKVVGASGFGLFVAALRDAVGRRGRHDVQGRPRRAGHAIRGRDTNQVLTRRAAAVRGLSAPGTVTGVSALAVRRRSAVSRRAMRPMAVVLLVTARNTRPMAARR